MAEKFDFITQPTFGRLVALWNKATTPTSKDEEEARREHSARIILTLAIITSISTFPILLVVHIAGIYPLDMAIYMLLAAIISVVGMIFVQTKLKAVPGLLIVILTFSFAARDVSVYGINEFSLMQYTFVLFFTFLLFGKRALNFVLLLVLLANFFLGSYLDPFGTEYWDIAFPYYVIPVCVYYIFVTALLRFIAGQYNVALRKARRLTDKLKKEIEERKQVEKALVRAKRKAEESEKIKDQLFTNMSHEIRTPMNAVVGISNLLLKTSLDSEQQKYIHSLKLSADNLLMLINDILDFSRANTGKLNLKKNEFSIKDAVEDVINSVKYLAVEKGLALECEIDNEIPKNVIGDSDRLKQVLLNLLSNAVKFTNSGKVDVKVDLMGNLSKSVKVKFVVADTGIGIEKSNRKKIFESYRQLDPSITRQYGGSGLGLAIVKKIVELQDGQVNVKSKLGEGSTFSLVLNFRKAKAPLKKLNGKEKKLEKSELKFKGNVLVIEDNKLNQMVIKRILEGFGVKVSLAESGSSGLRMLKNKVFDLVFLDIQMPRMDGYQVARKIRDEHKTPTKDIPIIALSAHAQKREIKLAFKAGMNDYIVKPFHPDALHDVLSHLLVTKRKIRRRVKVGRSR